MPGPDAGEIEESHLLEQARKRFSLRPLGEAPPARLAGDIGTRRYYRVAAASGASVLLVLYPEPLSRAQAAWTAIRSALASAGLRVPGLFDDAPELGAALVEDLGDRDLAADLAEAPAEDRPRLLDEAEEMLLAIRSLPRAAATFHPPFDAAFFASELQHTRLWALERGGPRPLPPERAALWDSLAASLAEAAADPRRTGDAVPTHRDFHANNLLRAASGELVPIDFQDLRLGPPDYDPVSLRFERAGSRVPCEAAPYAEAVLLQRAWKVFGTFEKMLVKGREIYRPHRDATRAVLESRTSRGGPFSELLAFLDRP